VARKADIETAFNMNMLAASWRSWISEERREEKKDL
jgi:hypothetical protein